MNKRMLATDLDGTLLNDRKELSENDFQTLWNLKESGTVITVATGRSIQIFDKALADISRIKGFKNFPFDYIIFSTGAGIAEFPSRKLIYQKHIDPPDIEKITRVFGHLQIDYMVHKKMPDSSYFAYKYFDGRNPDFHTRLDWYQKFVLPFPASFKDFGPATQVLGIAPENRKDLIHITKEKLDQFSVIHATSPLDHKSLWIEVFHKDVSKSRSVSWLADRLDIDRENVVSVGNDYNDEDLLSWAGISYVVDNAPDILKEKYTAVPSNNQSGVSHAVKKAGLI